MKNCRYYGLANCKENPCVIFPEKNKEEFEEIELPKDKFEEIKELMNPYIKDHCNYCGIKIDKTSFGFLSRDITSCNNIICLTQAIEDKENIINEVKG